MRSLVPMIAFLTLVLTAFPASAGTTFVDATSDVFPDGLARGHYLWGDCEGDGDDDLLVGGKTIYLNEGSPDFRLLRHTATGDLGGGNHQRALWLDLDNDGDLDLVGIGNGDREELFLNEGECSFVSISDQDGDGTPDLADGAPSTTATVGDIDADGDLDLYVGTYERQCTQEICGDCMVDKLWRNEGDNTFTDVTVSSGIDAGERALAGNCMLDTALACTSDADCTTRENDTCKSGLCARGSNWVDYDDDGDQDIFVSNYRLDPNFLWENDGSGNFVNVAFDRNVDGDEDSGSWGHVLGSDWADYDNDGDMDLYTAALAHNWGVALFDHDISQLLQSSGPPSYDFVDVRPSSGMRPFDTGVQADWAETCPAWADIDNDGILDLYATHIYASSTENYSTMNEGHDDGTFTPGRTMGADLGLYHDYSAAWSDFDQDGDLDLVTCGADCPEGCESNAHFFRNDGALDAPWLQIRARGAATDTNPRTNRTGVGVRIVATEGALSQMREVQGGHGYHTAMNSAVQHFGFGTVGDDAVDTVTVRWTTGVEDVFDDVPVDVRYLAVEDGTVRRGTSATDLQDLAPGGNLFPFRDSALGDGQSYFYRVEGDVSILLERDDAAGDVVISAK
jgi:hypothetical protein